MIFLFVVSVLWIDFSQLGSLRDGGTSVESNLLSERHDVIE